MRKSVRFFFLFNGSLYDLLTFVFVLALIPLNTTITNACDQSSINVTNGVDNGDGTYTYVVNICIGIKPNWGATTTFTLSADQPILSSGYTSGITTSYSYCDDTLNGNGSSCTMDVGGTVISTTVTATGNVIGGNLTFTNSGGGDPISPNDIFADCSDCGNPDALCFNVTFMTAAIILTIDLLDIEGSNNPGCSGNCCTSEADDSCFTFLNPITFISTENCAGMGVDVQIFGGVPGFSTSNYYITNTGTGTLSSTTVSASASGGMVIINGLNIGDSYSVTVTDDNSCTADFSGGPFPGSDATITPTGPFITKDPPVNLIAADPGGTWSGTGITDPSSGTFDPGTAGVGTHTITYTIPGSCGSTASVNIIVFEISNALTPNGDGDNETFYIDNIEGFPNNELRIYNRWGSMVYKINGYNNQWDGTKNGKLLPVATYFYVLDLNNGYKKYKGTVSILR